MKKINAKTSLFALALSVGLVFSAASQAEAVDQKQLFEQSRKELSGKVSENTLNQLQALVQAEPSNSQAHLNLGLVLDHLGLTEPAAEQFELAVRYGADNPDALVELCKEEIKSNRIAPAIAILNEGIQKFPNNAEMLYLVGDYLYQQRSFEDGQRLFERAYQINPNLFGLSSAFGQSILDTNPLRAANLASHDLKSQPSYFRALFVRGMAFKALGRYKEASVDLQKVFDRQPMLPVVSESLAQCYYWLGDYDKALKPAMVFSCCTVSGEAENSGNLPGLMRILVKLPRDQVVDKVAKVDIELALRRFLRPEFCYLMGKAFDALDMPHAAIQQYDRSIAMEPNNARSYFRKALNQELYLRDYDSALKNYQTAYNQRPWDSNFTVAYMRLQDRMHNRNEDIAWRFKDWINKTFSTN
ncbi:MAG: tetratricopeptide repeat protein [Candidatus Melainabacteria bacterium]|nr:tetratricopeptide repeat protein [Candidatus Melainabacteria bacterium]